LFEDIDAVTSLPHCTFGIGIPTGEHTHQIHDPGSCHHLPTQHAREDRLKTPISVPPDLNPVRQSFRETTMSHFPSPLSPTLLTSLLQLSDVTLAEEITAYTNKAAVTGDTFDVALAELTREEEAKRVKASAADVLSLFREADTYITNQVQSARELRRQADNMIKKVKEISIAREYGTETRNYLPLAILVGKLHSYNIPASNKALTEVPEGWVPKTLAEDKG